MSYDFNLVRFSLFTPSYPVSLRAELLYKRVSGPPRRHLRVISWATLAEVLLQ